MLNLRLIALLLLIWLLYRWLKPRLGKRKPSLTRQRGGNSGEDMVKCAVCGLHVPRGEALHEGQRYFCSEAHYRQRDKD